MSHYTEDFIRAVYPDMTERAMLANTEKTCLEDATELIRSLRALVAVGREMAEQFTRCMDVGDKHFKTYATGPGRALVAKWRCLEGKR